MYVCLCKGITAEQVVDAVKQGATSVEAVGITCEAGSDCGSCRFKVHRLIKATLEQSNLDTVTLLCGSARQGNSPSRPA